MLIDSATLKEPIKPKAGSTLNNMRKAELIKEDAADVAPVVHGRWRRSGGLIECICGEIYCTTGGNEGKAWNFCPDCGARMDGGAD